MAFTLKLPEVGETVTEGTIERWLKKPGDQVAKYEPIVEVNTDKVNVELPCPVSGTLKEILAQEGETVAVGADLCVIDEVAGEVPAEIGPPKPAEEPAPAKAPAAAPEPEPVAAAAPSPSRNTSGNGARQPNRATPRVRKLAEELGVTLEALDGTGPGGRIVEEDVRAAAAGAPAKAGVAVEAPPAAAAPARPGQAAPSHPGADEESVALTGIRKTIAQRMSASAFSAPSAWLAMEADVTELVKLRESKKEAFRQRHGVDLTYLPFMAHAVAQTLLEHPYLNASWGEDKIVLKKRINLAIAVATDRGLMVPVVRDADRLSVAGLARAMSDLGERTRDNKLTLEDVQGGTFTLDNTGAFGALISQPIINHGQSAIITLEAITKQPRVVADSAIAVRSVVMICLSFDHRVMDGHQAGYFLRDVKKRLEAFGPESGID
ncbi:MAG TPA: dihydrolipoamide acetyltransferase family protein [Dehalococcoidia bacterium]|nr:dihydrolipoamide acetyltransferase family protein [Dehalococcoidia bacterium]